MCSRDASTTFEPKFLNCPIVSAQIGVIVYFMSGLKTFVVAIGLTFGSSVGPVTAAEDTLLRQFAHCAGRLSALMEHQWMFDGPGSERTAAERAQMIDLIDALIAPEQGTDVLNWRIEAKFAYAALLQRATFTDDIKEKQWATRTSIQLMDQCRGLLLS